MNKKILSLITAITLTAAAIPQLPATSSAANNVTQMEYLDRGTVAVKVTNGVYLSWRLLGTENYNTAFDIYRGTTKIATVSDSTNYTDTSGKTSNTYTVVQSGRDVSEGEAVSVWDNQYITIPLDRPKGGTSLDGDEYTYTPNDVEPADVDGDGEYELILKWEPSNSFDSGKVAHHNGNVYIDCYELDGTKLWRIDMGININAGAHFTQIAAYDFDLDGKAEIAFKTAPGTKDGQGNYVSAASSTEAIKNTDNAADYRHTEGGTDDTNGRVMSGPEYYTVFQGDTGAALDTIYYPHPRGTVTEWGDNWGNRSERFLSAVAYLDGVNPSMVAWRGYYAKTTATAYNLVNKRLVQVADFDTSKSGYSKFAGNGNHNLAVGDVDNDGCDEIICGSLALDNDFSVLWCSGRGHGDALHLADYDPVHEGMEYFSVHEDWSGGLITGSTTGHDGEQHLGGMTLYDAENGNELFHKDGYRDTGRGMMANVNYGDGYFELWGAGNYVSYGESDVAQGSFNPDSTNFRIFWDGDLYDELLDGVGSSNTGNQVKISKPTGRIMSIRNAININGTKNNPCLQADLFGDWREEIVLRGTDNNSLMIYTTTIPTEHKLYTLMHDRAYRMQVACQNSGYNQPPHIGYYVNDDNDVYDARKYAAYIKTVHNGKTAIRTSNLPDEKPDIRPSTKPMPTPTPTPTPAPPTPTPTDNPDFDIQGSKIIGYKGQGGDIVIPERINGDTVTSIGNYVFSFNTAVLSIDMPNSITELSGACFYGCSNLKNTTLSKSILSLSSEVFKDCTALEKINLQNVYAINFDCFKNCEALTELDLSEVGYIGTDAFAGCTGLTKVVFGKSSVMMDDCGLESNGKLIIYAPYDSSAHKYAVQHNIPFVSTNGTPTPKPTDTPEPTATPTPTPEIKQFAIEDGVLIGYNGDDLSVVIPETYEGQKITAIGSDVFSYNPDIVSITIPDTVTDIQEYAFTGCSSLISIKLPKDLTEIKDGTFEDCSNLENITWPRTIKKIDNGAFANCSRLKAVKTEDCEEIGRAAFYWCSSIEEIALKGKIKEMHQLLWGCSNLKKVTVYGMDMNLSEALDDVNSSLVIYGYNGSKAQLFADSNDVPFYDLETGQRIITEWVVDNDGVLVKYNGDDVNIVVPSEVNGKRITAIGESTFAYTGIESVTLPESIEQIYWDAFRRCKKLKKVVLSNGITSLVDVFTLCSRLEYIYIPASVTEIEYGIFDSCPDISIYGEAGSKAEEYAKENNIPFYTLGKYGDLSMSFESGKLHITNNTERAAEAVLYTAKYENNALKEIESEKIEIPADGFVSDIYTETGMTFYLWSVDFVPMADKLVVK